MGRIWLSSWVLLLIIVVKIMVVKIMSSGCVRIIISVNVEVMLI